jgi:RHS repeat-associated protein
MWEPVPSPFDPVWVPDWNIWLPAFSPDALKGSSEEETNASAYLRPPGWIPWNPLPPCRQPWPPIFLPLPWEPPYLPSENQAIYLGSGTSLVDGAGAVCTHTNVALLAATGQTGFSLPFPTTSFPAFGGYTHLTSPTPGGTYLNTLYSWHKISLAIVRVRGGQGTPIESYRPNQAESYEYIVYDADGTALRFHWAGGQLIPAFGVWAQLRQLGDTYVLIAGPPGALNQKGAWLYFFTGASDGYAWGSAPKARVLAIRDPLGNYWRQGRDDRFPNRMVWVSSNNVYLGIDPDGTVYFSANENPPQWQRLGKTPPPLASGDPRGSSEIIYWGDPTDPRQHIAYRWSVSLPVGADGVTLEAGYLQGNTFVPQVQHKWRFTGEPQGYTNGRGERELYTTLYGSLPANYYGRLYRQFWGDTQPTWIEYRNATPFGVETTIYREGLSGDYTLLRHVESDNDKKFNTVEVERPRFDETGVSLERVWLSSTNGQPIRREFFDFRASSQPLWQETYEYHFADDPLALTGYVDRQGNRYSWEYERRETGISWDPANPEKETVLRRATDPTGVEIYLHYGEGYTLPPWQMVRRNPPTVPSSVQLGSHSERRWRFGYTFASDLQRPAPNGLLLGFKEPERDWWLFEYTTLADPHPYQLKRVIDPTGRFHQITAWDAFGRPRRTEVYPYWSGLRGGWNTDRPVWQEVAYDPVGRVQRVSWGYQEAGRTYLNGSVWYQWQGHLLRGFTDARGRQVQFLYDDPFPHQTGLLTEIKINGQIYAALGYDWWGRLTSVKGGNGVGVEYRYTYRDALQTIQHTGDPNPEKFWYSDCCGQLSRWRRQDGQELSFDHTPNGWLQAVHYKGLNDPSPRELYRYDYDPAGRLTLAQSAVSTVRHFYDTTDTDRTGWLERTETDLGGRTYTFDYDYYLNGDLRGFRWQQSGLPEWYPPISSQQFTYDGAGRLETHTYQKTTIGGSTVQLTITYRYDGAGRLEEQQVQARVGTQPPKTLTTTIAYADHESIGSVGSQTTKWNGTEVARYEYHYYADGTVQRATETHGASRRQLQWDYYSDGSLAYEQDGFQRRDFRYDAGGNLTHGVPAAPTLTAEYQFNQLRSLGNWTFSYNLNGERIGELNAPDGTREYGYDGFGNLIWVKRNGQLIYEARYDALGRRVAYRTGANEWSWVYLLYDGDALVAELDAYGQVRVEYVWGLLGPVARIEGGQVQLYVCDALGHVRALIDAQTGQITDRYDYDAWGNLVYRAGITQQPFTWNGAYGYEWIPETGLYHVGARAYDPRTARWLQRDPIDAASGDPNLYRYCGNDPLNTGDSIGCQYAPKQGQQRHQSAQTAKSQLGKIPPQKPVEPGDPRFPKPPEYPRARSLLTPDPGTYIAEWVALHYLTIRKTISDAYAIMYKHFPPGPLGINGGPADAFRHGVWACLVQRELGDFGYQHVVVDHENPSAYWAKGSWNEIHSPMDLANDAVGKRCAGQKGKSCEQACLDALKRGELYVLPKKYWTK